MKFLLLSDLHLTNKNPTCRTDDLVEEQFKKLEFVLDYALENRCDFILQAGDFFNTPRSYPILSKTIELLNKRKYIKCHDIMSIYGQHDMYFRNKDDSTSLGILKKADLINILDQNPIKLKYVSVYGCSFGEEIPTPEDKTITNILVIHKDISNVELFPGHKYSEAGKFLKKHKDYDLILCGDIHKEFVSSTEDRFLVNTGPMLRSSITDYDHKPCFYVYDVGFKRLERVEIPHKKNKDCMSKKHIEHKKEIDEMMDDFIDLMRESNIKTVDIVKNINEYCKENKIEKAITTIIQKTMEESCN